METLILLQAQSSPTDYFTIEFLSTFAGASTSIYFIANMWQRFMNKNPMIPAFILSVLLVFLHYAYPVWQELNWWHLIIIPLNALFVFASALGITEMSNRARSGNANSLKSMKTEENYGRTFTTSWLN